MRSSLLEVVDIPTQFTRRSNGFVVSMWFQLFCVGLPTSIGVGSSTKVERLQKALRVVSF